MLQQSCGEVIVLPNDMECLEIATHLANDLRAQGRRVAVIPTVAQVQGLAALAVHEPGADFDSVVVAMSSTAGHARHAAVTVAESPAMTMAGRCEVGDVLGLVDGDFVEIGDDLTEVAWRVIERLLTSGGGELVTLVGGLGADDQLLGRLRARIRAWSPTIDVESIDGGQTRVSPAGGPGVNRHLRLVPELPARDAKKTAKKKGSAATRRRPSVRLRSSGAPPGSPVSLFR